MEPQCIVHLEDSMKRLTFRELVFFHEMLEVCSREGGTNSVQVLLDIAEDFEKTKSYTWQDCVLVCRKHNVLLYRTA